MMSSLLWSFLLVVAAEFGDKTQLLAMALATRFQRPALIMIGIAIATVANHVFAASLGYLGSEIISGQTLRVILGLIYVAFAIWILIPDHDEDWKTPDQNVTPWGIIRTTAILFFLAEMGDKTQVTTGMLAATYSSITIVTIGSTLGMLVADGIGVLLAHRYAALVNPSYVRWGAAILFLAFGLAQFF